MASPQAENGYLRIATEIIKQFARLNLSAYEWRVLWAILLKTWGWQKKSDSIPVSQIAKMTGILAPHVSRAKASLLKKRLLFERAGKIGFQKDYELWEIKSFCVTDSGNESITDSGNKTAQTVTDSGRSVTDSGNKTLPNQGDSIDKKGTVQKKESKTSPESFAAYWNSKTSLPRIRSMTKGRKTKLADRLKDSEFADHWQEVIDNISQSAFCTGHNDRGWMATIDWLLVNSTNYVKVLEGKYNNKPKPEPGLDSGKSTFVPKSDEEIEQAMTEIYG